MLLGSAEVLQLNSKGDPLILAFDDHLSVIFSPQTRSCALFDGGPAKLASQQFVIFLPRIVSRTGNQVFLKQKEKHLFRVLYCAHELTIAP